MSNEFSLIQQYFSGLSEGPFVERGIGDDAATLRLPEGHVLHVSTDTALVDVHFPSDLPAADIAYRSLMAAASDLAAMGAEPIALLVSLTLPEIEDDWLRDFTAGLQEACLETGLPLAGGDTTRGALSLTVTVLGSTPKAQFLTREGAKSGDRVCVSGTLGDASAGLAISTDKVAVSCPIAKRALQARFTRPAARLTLGQDLRGLASAAIDISDGLLADARHLATASDIAIEIDSQRIPLSDALRSLGDAEQALQWALAGGDDYELLFCLPPDAELPEGCTEIGRVVTGSGISCDVMPEQLGYDHFTHRPA